MMSSQDKVVQDAKKNAINYAQDWGSKHCHFYIALKTSIANISHLRRLSLASNTASHAHSGPTRAPLPTPPYALRARPALQHLPQSLQFQD